MLRRSSLRRSQKKDEAADLSGRLVTLLDPTSVAAEAYRALRTNLIYAAVGDPPKVVLVTSTGPREGKSTTCANLAVTLAQAGKRTLLVDCDLRKPAVHKTFGLRNIWGMVDVLAGSNDLAEIWHEPLKDLKVVTVGPIPPNPTELLGSRRFAAFVQRARKGFDHVLLDSPPVGLVSDATIIAPQSDGVLLVLDAQSTRKGSVRRGIRALEAVGASVIGTVMNNVAASAGEPYYAYPYE